MQTGWFKEVHVKDIDSHSVSALLASRAILVKIKRDLENYVRGLLKPADEARRVLRRLEFHYVPKHASWLNMVEIEIGVLARQCLDRRIDNFARLVAETAAWEKRRNADRARVK
jgi:transposase